MTVAQEPRFSEKVLNLGFVFALILSAVCFGMSVGYLFVFQGKLTTTFHNLLNHAASGKISEKILDRSIDVEMILGRFSLLSCAIMVGLAFGFLGFALFLIGIRGEMDVEASHEKASIKIARIAPGVFVILAATVMITMCTTFRPEIRRATTTTSPQTPVSPPVVPPEHEP